MIIVCGVIGYQLVASGKWICWLSPVGLGGEMPSRSSEANCELRESRRLSEQWQ